MFYSITVLPYHLISLGSWEQPILSMFVEPVCMLRYWILCTCGHESDWNTGISLFWCSIIPSYLGRARIHFDPSIRTVSQYKSLMIRLIWVFILVKLLTCVIRHINRLVNWALKALHHIRLHRSTFFLYLSTLSNIQSPSLMGGSGGRLFH